MLSDIEYYFDYAASTPVDPEVIRVMTQSLEEHPYNPHAHYHQSTMVSQQIDLARERVSECIHADPDSIIWTSGATESINLALYGTAKFYQGFKKHIITSTIEHSATKQVLKQLAKEGFEISYVSVDHNGRINLDQLRTLVRRDTLLVSVIAVHNEIGVTQALSEIAEIAHAVGAFFHVDAAQAIGKIDINVEQQGIDLLSLSAHKCYGPKGVGALYRKKNPLIMLRPLLFGGEQQQRIRPGTLPTHQIVGMGKAYQLTQLNQKSNHAKSASNAKALIQGLKQLPHTITIHVDAKYRVNDILSFQCHDVDRSALIEFLKPFQISTHSSCINQQQPRDHVLYACLSSLQAVNESIRIGMGRYTSRDAINGFVAQLNRALSQLTN
ncbi:MAG: IscS subfamily cysteine desulfurase [Legionellales bacterium]|nr:IscS subfamily cysteine desulfurase [Legionellales bacterium]|tara:strand:- start:2639 stop:3787 length:1149 start_codon:yes stop_codon:yes gene_type:complete